MHLKTAALQCKKVIKDNKHKWNTNNFDVSAEHCLDMCDKIIEGEVLREKGHRWLGWLQGCMCAFNVASLKELKNINYES